MHETTSIANQPQGSSATLADEAVPVQERQFDTETELIDRFPIQLKLSVGAPNDPLEYEADAMADKVMRMPESTFIQRKSLHESNAYDDEHVQLKPLTYQQTPFVQRCSCNNRDDEHVQLKPMGYVSSFIQRKSSCSCGDYDDEHIHLKPLVNQITPFVQAKGDSGATVSDSVSGQIRSTMGSGDSMQGNTKSFMENRFGADFGDVKIHTGSESAQLSRALNAKAFTVSNNIYFNSGQYQPDTSSGKHLLAHELTHVVQQKMSGPFIARSVDDWLKNSSRRMSDMSYTQLLAEIDELTQWLGNQISTSVDSGRIEETLTLLRTEVNARDKQAVPSRPRAPKAKNLHHAAHPAVMPELPTRMPRVLLESASIVYGSPEEMRTEYDLIMQWLTLSNVISEDQRSMLIAEKTGLAPQLKIDRARVIEQRYRARLQVALTPSGQNSADDLQKLAGIIQGIYADPSTPGIYYIYQNNERVAISTEQRESLRRGFILQLESLRQQVGSRNGYYWNRYHSQQAINRDFPITSGIVGWLADVKDPGSELSERYLSNARQLGILHNLLQAGKLTEAAAIVPEIENVSQQIRSLARAFYEGYIEGAEALVTALEITRDACFAIAASIAAVVAAPVVAGFVGAGGLGATGVTASVLTIGGTGVTVGTGMAVVRGGSAATGTLLAGGSFAEARKAFGSEGRRGFKEGFMAGAAGGAARILGPALGVGTQVGAQALRRIAAEAIVNGTSTMVETLLSGGTLEQAVKAGLTSAALSAPGAVVGGSGSRLVRELGGPLTAGGTAYLAALASGASPEEALRQVSVAVTSSILMNRATHGSEQDAALEQAGRSAGKTVRQGVIDPVARTTRSVAAAIVIGASNALPSSGAGYGANQAQSDSQTMGSITHAGAAPYPKGSTLPHGVDQVTHDSVEAAFADGAAFDHGSKTEITPRKRRGGDTPVPSTDTLNLTTAQRQAGRNLIGHSWSQDLKNTWNSCSNQQAIADMAEVNRLWTAGDHQAARTLARSTFGNWTERFYRAVGKNTALKAGITDAGIVYQGNGRSPYYQWPDGYREALTIEHATTRLTDDPRRAVDPNNFVFSMSSENEHVLEAIRRGERR